MNKRCVNCHSSCKDKGCSGNSELDCLVDENEPVSASDSLMFKIFIGLTILYSIISVYGFFKDNNDKRKSS